MRIIVDMDEVLAQFVKEVLKRWNDEADTNFVRDDINMWQMEKTLGANSFEKITEWMTEPGFFENLEPFPGAIDGFNTLRKKHDVVIATSLAGGLENGFDSKRRWVAKHFPDFSMKNFICTSRKDLLTADILIDDAAHFLDAWRAAGNDRAIIMHAKWNKDVKHFPRALNWGQVLNIINFWEAFDAYQEMQNEIYLKTTERK